MINNQKQGILSRLKSGLKKTSSQLSTLFTGSHIDNELWDELYERLILADVGVSLTGELLQKVKNNKAALKSPSSLLEELKKEAVSLLPAYGADAVTPPPRVILAVGVNGAGKTTTLVKIAKKYKDEGKKVCLCAADTFRAAAIGQLKNWAEKIGVSIVAPQEGSDPAAAAFEAVTMGKQKGFDIVMIDTAGRLHTKHNLMEELKKIARVTGKARIGAPDEVLLVLDGTAGQNALMQAKTFHETVGITAIAITKLDGTAKGGIVLRIAYELGLPVKYVGFGEKQDDLMEFDPVAYVDAVFNG